MGKKVRWLSDKSKFLSTERDVKTGKRKAYGKGALVELTADQEKAFAGLFEDPAKRAAELREAEEAAADEESEAESEEEAEESEAEPEAEPEAPSPAISYNN